MRDDDLIMKKFTKKIPKSGIVAYFIKEKPRTLKETGYTREISELTAGQFKYENMLRMLTHPSQLDNSPDIEI